MRDHTRELRVVNGMVLARQRGHGRVAALSPEPAAPAGWRGAQQGQFGYPFGELPPGRPTEPQPRLW